MERSMKLLDFLIADATVEDLKAQEKEGAVKELVERWETVNQTGGSEHEEVHA